MRFKSFMENVSMTPQAALQALQINPAKLYGGVLDHETFNDAFEAMKDSLDPMVAIQIMQILLPYVKSRRPITT